MATITDGLGLSLETEDTKITKDSPFFTADLAGTTNDAGDTKSSHEKHAIFYSSADALHWDTVSGSGDLAYRTAVTKGLNYLEYKQLVIAAEDCSKDIEKLQNRHQAVVKEIQGLMDLTDPSHQEMIENLRSKNMALIEDINQKIKTQKEIKNKMQLVMMHYDFQKEILALWNKEEHYRNWIEETGLTPAQALLQVQGHVLTESHNFTFEMFASEYIRLGRQDIADLISALKDPINHVSVFETAKKEYERHPDYNYGLVLSLCFENGYGTEVDKKAALDIDQRFAAKNHPIALVSLANEYFKGGLLPLDQKKGIDLYERATAKEQHFFYFPHVLWGQRLMEGDGVEKDEMRGLTFLKMADEQGCTFATPMLQSYFSDKVEALEMALANTEEDAGDEVAAIATAPSVITSQEEIKQAKDQAYFYARKMDATGSIIGKIVLGTCYFRGWGVPQEPQRYIDVLHQYETTSPLATEALANAYQYGAGNIDADAIRSLKLHFSALRSTCLGSFEDFKKLIASNLNNPEFMAIAFDLCKKCLQGHLLDNALDSTIIGLFYQHGILVPKNMERSIACFKKAADLGESEAATFLVLMAKDSENSAILPLSTAREYFSHATDDPGVSEVRKHYQTNFLPLFGTLKQTWAMLNLGKNWNMPDDITQIIAQYADTILDKKKKDNLDGKKKDDNLKEPSAATGLGVLYDHGDRKDLGDSKSSVVSDRTPNIELDSGRPQASRGYFMSWSSLNPLRLISNCRKRYLASAGRLNQAFKAQGWL